MDAPEPTVAQIVAMSAAAFGLTRAMVLSPRRDMPTVECRHTAMWLAHRLTALSLPQLGRELRRDHTTVMHGIARIKRRIAHDPLFAARVLELLAAIGAARP